jgi:hypothetical protein
VIHIGLQGLAGYLIPVVMVLCGLLLLFHPLQRVFYSVLAVLLALGSWITSNLGGFFVGMLLGLVGGSLAFAWQQRDEHGHGQRRRRRPRDDPSGGLELILGQPPADAGGLPPKAGGLPPKAGGLPPKAGGLPADAGGLPPKAGGLPADAGGLPADAGGLPADAGGLPAKAGPAGQGAPADGARPAPTTADAKRDRVHSGSARLSGGASGALAAAVSPRGITAMVAIQLAPLALPMLATRVPPGPAPAPDRTAHRAAAREPAMKHAQRPARPPVADAPAPAARARLTAGLAMLTGLSFDGVADVPTAAGRVPMLRLSMTSLRLSGGIMLVVTQGGHASITRDSSIGFSGNIVLYATRISGRLNGTRVIFEPKRPPSGRVAEMTLTDVVANQPDVSADSLLDSGFQTAPG